MRALTSSLRKQLESAVVAARRASESASRAALDGLGVFTDRRPEHLGEAQAALRNGLRAKQRQLGGDPELLVAECAYEQWHRLLFARFLSENDLLLHPQYGAPVTLQECEELAADLAEPDGWSVAARFAAEILPGIFRRDDPCVRLRFAPEGRDALERIIGGLPAEVFAADDALGWVYQYWQKDKKDEVNASERKIGGADLGPVTQLFTEDYMVRFLLENSLGAWWASRRPTSPLIKGFDYLRFDDEGKPAAGSFTGWPERAASVTVIDPCCGSGHFLVEAFSMLWQMRAEEEGLDPVPAQDAVLAENLFGLELDSRCVQIAMFAVALSAWKAGAGWRELPMPQIACSGIPAKAPLEEWTALSHGDERLREALTRLHGLFRKADTLGSLIDPRRAAAGVAGWQRTLGEADWKEIAPLVEQLANHEGADPATAVLGADAAGIARAAKLLSASYTLVVTNVPYVGQPRQSHALKEYVEAWHWNARHDLAVAFLDRWWLSRDSAGGVAVVSPSEWLYIGRYESFRRAALNTAPWHLVARLGQGAFTTPLRAAPQLTIASNPPRLADAHFRGINLDESPTLASEKSRLLPLAPTTLVNQEVQLRRSDARVLFVEFDTSASPLGAVATGLMGIGIGDAPRFERNFWEVPSLRPDWEYLQSTVTSTQPYGGRSKVVFWENGRGQIAALAQTVKHLNHAAQNWQRGRPSWGKRGVVVSQMGELPCTLYLGDRYDLNCCAVVPEDQSLVPALWEFARSGELARWIRQIDQSMKVPPRSILAVPFDVERWRRVAGEAGPISQPRSDDPTQWLFEGRPEATTAALKVAVARLLGYRWPEQPEADELDSLSDADGIVCLPSVAGEPPAAERLQQVLAAGFGGSWSPAKLKELLEQAGSKKKTLEDWLLDEFFKQHCAVFGSRPFVWHIWDGRRDGFSALVNYHRLDRKTLSKLTYTYLGQDWVERQRAAVREEVAGSEGRLAAALELQRKLEAILAGEKPFDIYARWKTLHEQPIGWEPDLNDGVRLNIRPFVEAGVLRSPFSIHWTKDRGKNPDGSERHNDAHLSLADKLEARKRAAAA